ncbi:sperm microtubule inner protein 11-like [Clytia hemisphaerica]|uniref:sperm microtubule inner protein 11-like n=1 Tax=Clytia hemisphaerica TaxID=252671 RepID=UPI0034D45BF6
MSFFNLTKLGVQDPIKSSLKECKEDHHKESKKDDEAKSPQKNCSTPESLLNKNDTTQIVAQSNSEAQGSYVKYTERLTKHQRTQHDPNEIYRNPVTSSQEYGWWRQDGAPESLPWTKVPNSSARTNSEMTRFVDEMTLTNKHFTLF